jgi:hypothetical protein
MASDVARWLNDRSRVKCADGNARQQRGEQEVVFRADDDLTTRKQ